jgi:uncharacterized protein
MEPRVSTAIDIPVRIWAARVWVVQALLLGVLGAPAWAETVQAVSRPTRTTWVVDRTGVLSEKTLVELDELGSQIERSGQGQLVIAVVDTTGRRAPRAFATELFNRWGVGHARRDDGVMLFVALRDRKAEIILGDGVDTPADVARSEELMRSRIVPAFRAGNTDGAVLDGARGLKGLLEQSSLNTGLKQAVGPKPPAPAISPPAPREPVKPRAQQPAAPAQERKEFLDDEGMYVDMHTSETPAPSTEPPAPGLGSSPASSQSTTVPWVWVLVVGFFVVLIVANLLRRRGVTCKRCGSMDVKVSTWELLEATESNDGLVEVTVRCRRCGHESTSTRNTSSRESSHSHPGSGGGGSSSGQGASGTW